MLYFSSSDSHKCFTIRTLITFFLFLVWAALNSMQSWILSHKFESFIAADILSEVLYFSTIPSSNNIFFFAASFAYVSAWHFNFFNCAFYSDTIFCFLIILKVNMSFNKLSAVISIICWCSDILLVAKLICSIVLLCKTAFFDMVVVSINLINEVNIWWV